jgi:uncharacterized membrane protein YccC
VSEPVVVRDHRERWLRIAAILIVIGLGIEIISLRWTHPTAFVVFAAGTGLCIGAGVLLFLGALFSTGPAAKP